MNGQAVEETRETIINKMKNHPDFDGDKPEVKEIDDELQAARDAYESITGKKPHHKSGVDKIKADIEALENGED